MHFNLQHLEVGTSRDLLTDVLMPNNIKNVFPPPPSLYPSPLPLLLFLAFIYALKAFGTLKAFAKEAFYCR